MNKTVSELLSLYEHLIKAQTSLYIVKNNLTFLKNNNLKKEFEQLGKNISDIITPDLSDIATEYKQWKTTPSNDPFTCQKNDNICLRDSEQFKKLKELLTNLYIKELTENSDDHKEELLNTLSGLNNFSYTAKINVIIYNDESKEIQDYLTYGVVLTFDCIIQTYTTDTDTKTNLCNKLNRFWDQKIIRKFDLINCNELIFNLLKAAENNKIKFIGKHIELKDPMETNPSLTINIEDYLNKLPFMSQSIENQIELLKKKLTTITAVEDTSV